MSYQVIARKYRPQSFDDLTGQEHITRTLSHALDGERLHHAYIFSGVRGTGKTTTARILAKGLNCHHGITSRPCLACPSCLEIAAGNSMDVLEIDAASNTGVDNVREVIINNLALAPARDRYKVFVIDEVHMLSTSAFNALLKTLEEPPAHVIFILATTELHKVPETILSRCQQFEFRHIATEKIFDRLREIAILEGVTIEEEALREIARAGAGSLRDAQSAFDQVIAFSGSAITVGDVGSSLGLVSAATLQQFVEAIAHQRTAQLLELVDAVYSRGYDARNFTRELMGCFRHLLFIRSGIESGEISGITDVEAGGLKRLAPLFSEDDLVRCFRLLAGIEKEIKDSPQPRFQLELGLVGLARLRRLRSLEELITRLEALESGLPKEAKEPKEEAGDNGEKGRFPAPRPTEDAPASVVSKMDYPVPPGARTESSERSRSVAPAGRGTAEIAPPPSIRPSLAGPPSAGPSLTGPPSAEKDTRARISGQPDPPPVIAATRSKYESAPLSDSEPVDITDLTEIEDYPTFDPQPSSTAGHTSVKKTRSGPSVLPTTGEGAEVEAIITELQRLNRGLIETALAGARLEYKPGVLTATFASDDTFAQRIRESHELFRSIGERLFGLPLRVEVRVGGEVTPVVNQEAQLRERLRQQAMENPVVRQILEQTRGEITGVSQRKS